MTRTHTSATVDLTAGLNELEGLLTGIKSAVALAQQHCDSDHVNFHGLAQLVERADLVVLDLQTLAR